MCTFAGTAIINLPFLFAGQGKNFRFPLLFAANKQKFAVSAFRLQKLNRSCHFSVSSVFRLRNFRNVETWTWWHGDMETWRWRHGDVDMETWTWRHGHGDIGTSNGKRKPRRFSLICVPFAQWVNGSLSFVDEETNGSNPFADGLNGLNGLAHLCIGILQYMTDMTIQNWMNMIKDNISNTPMLSDIIALFVFSLNYMSALNGSTCRSHFLNFCNIYCRVCEIVQSPCSSRICLMSARQLVRPLSRVSFLSSSLRVSLIWSSRPADIVHPKECSITLKGQATCRLHRKHQRSII